MICVACILPWPSKRWWKVLLEGPAVPSAMQWLLEGERGAIPSLTRWLGGGKIRVGAEFSDYGRLVLRWLVPLFCEKSAMLVVQNARSWDELIYCGHSSKYHSSLVFLGRRRVVFHQKDAFCATKWGGVWYSRSSKTTVPVVVLTVVVCQFMVRFWFRDVYGPNCC